MKNKPLVSIVIPAYNVERYVEKCIHSVVNQSYRNIEVIIVNDGSTDKTRWIIEKLSCLDKRIKIVNKENGGLSSARNKGIRIANGEYISFIDSDDWVDDHFIEIMLNTCIENNADISICNMSYIYDDGTIRKRTPIITHEKNVSGVQAFKDMLNGKMFKCHAVNKLYKTVLFKDNDVFYPVGKLYEDVFTTYKLICSAKTVSYIPKTMYYYLQNREGSILSSTFNENRMDVFDALSEIGNYIEEKNIHSENDFTYFVAENVISIVNYISPIYGSLNNRKKIVQRIKMIIDNYKLIRIKNIKVLGKFRYIRLFIMRLAFGVYTKLYVWAKRIENGIRGANNRS